MAKKDLHDPTNCWQTPEWLFNALNKEFNFQIDLCANEENRKCKSYYVDYLKDIVCVEDEPELQNISLPMIDWAMDSAFINPPYSNAKPFIQKAWDDSIYCRIVCLIKCDPSTTMWDIFTHKVNNGAYEYRVPMLGCTIRYITKRVQFDPAPELKAIYRNNKWYTQCHCYDKELATVDLSCRSCQGTAEKVLSGPTFATCVLIFDRRD